MRGAPSTPVQCRGQCRLGGRAGGRLHGSFPPKPFLVQDKSQFASETPSERASERPTDERPSFNPISTFPAQLALHARPPSRPRALPAAPPLLR